MSRFSRPPGDSYLVWSPAESGVRVEYAATLFREVRLESSYGGVDGVLYGVRRPGSVRVVTARREGSASDARLAGLEKVGIFATRERGEVFLTESDLERFEKLESAVVALVIAGTQGGFFVREGGGAIQSFRSHQEFSTAETGAAPEPAPKKMPGSLVFVRGWIKQAWPWIGLAIAALALIPLAAIPRLRFSRPPAALTVREDRPIADRLDARRDLRPPRSKSTMDLSASRFRSPRPSPVSPTHTAAATFRSAS